jgi:hypothetical protein
MRRKGDDYMLMILLIVLIGGTLGIALDMLTNKIEEKANK